MNARRYCVVIALTGVAGCFGDLMAADTPILAASLKPVSAFSTISDERVIEENLPRTKNPSTEIIRNKARTEVTMNDIAGEKIRWVGEHVGTA
jgi:hypothetical protein